MLTKNIAAWASFAIFALESLINFRQARLQDRQRQQTSSIKGDWVNGSLQRPEDLQQARLKVVFRTMTAGHFMLLVLLFVKMDVGPWLWTLSGDFQTAFLPSFTNEFWRSCFFLLSCLFIYLTLNLPNFIFRSIIMKDDVKADLAVRWKSTWSLHDLARDNVMPTVLLLITVSVLVYQACGFKFNQFYVLLFAAAQLIFCITYPLATQPNKKQLSLLDTGTLHDEIHELALGAELKLKKIYISTGPPPKDFEAGVQTFGWPRIKHLSIHETVIETCTEEDITALTAQKFGCWKHRKNIQAFIISNVRCLPPTVTLTLTLARR
jgi:STE24 endopeptidase